MYKFIEQAVRDYCALEYSLIPHAMDHWESARAFLFDDDYYIQWGDIYINLDRMCECIRIDIDWVRLKIKQRYDALKKKKKKKYKQLKI